MSKYTRRVLMAFLAALAVYADSSQAQLTNPDFENSGPDLTGWQVRGNVRPMPENPQTAGGGQLAFFEEPGDAGVSQIWQTFVLPAPLPAEFSFRYNFVYGASPSSPVLVAAVSRKNHANFGDVDIDIFGGHTESRSETILLPTSELLILATFDKRIVLLGLAAGDVTADLGIVGTPSVTHKTVTFTVTNIPSHTESIDIEFPGVVDSVFQDPRGASDALLCAVVVTGDYNNDARYDDADNVEVALLDGTPLTADNARADFNLDGIMDSWDTVDAVSLLNGPFLFCPDSFGGTPPASSGKDPAVPPDAFMAFLIKDTVNERLDGLVLALPSFTNALLYEDSDGNLLHDPLVTVSDEPDFDGLFAVTLDLSGVIGGQSARVVFALAGAANQVSSVLSVDDVAFDSPGGFCVDSNTGELTPIEDGLVCTEDTCNANGTVSHTLVACCGECAEVAADVVIMIDRTGSIDANDIAKEKDAAKVLLDRFALALPRPRVAIGTFNGPCVDDGPAECPTPNHARILAVLTDVYGEDGSSDTGLYAVINDITVGPSNGQTDMGSAINVAQSALPGTIDTPNYIVLISDGIPNIPDTPCVEQYCDCAAADTAANDAADSAENMGTDIIAIHFEGNGAQCSLEPAAGLAFMRDEIATDDPNGSFFFEGGTDLICPFYLVADLIACDDQDPCTADACVFGVCVHNQINGCP